MNKKIEEYYSVLEKALKQLRKEFVFSSPGVQDKKQDKPDFFRNIKEIVTGRNFRAWIEVTEIKPRDGKDQQKNAIKIKYGKHLEEKLKEILDEKDYGKLNITISFEKLPPRKTYLKDIDKLAFFIKNNLNKTNIWIEKKQLPRELQFITWIRIDNNKDPRAYKEISVHTNTSFNDALNQRIENCVKSKDEKRYKTKNPKIKPDDEVWLVIGVDDNVSSQDDLDKLKLTYMSKYLDRIYVVCSWLEEEYCPFIRLK